MIPDIVIEHYGLQDYAITRDAMLHFTAARTDVTADAIWLVEHTPVYTLGQAGRPAHVLRDNGIAVIRTERGGQVTYHGPGQVVAYPLIDLRRRGIKVREFVAAIEDAVLEVLAAYNLSGEKKLGAPGVYVAHQGELRKIAALGLKISNGCTFHGVSLNVAMDLAPFSDIDPCGYPGLKTIDMASLGVEATPLNVATVLADALIAEIGARTHRASP